MLPCPLANSLSRKICFSFIELHLRWNNVNEVTLCQECTAPQRRRRFLIATRHVIRHSLQGNRTVTRFVRSTQQQVQSSSAESSHNHELQSCFNGKNVSQDCCFRWSIFASCTALFARNSTVVCIEIEMCASEIARAKAVQSDKQTLHRRPKWVRSRRKKCRNSTGTEKNKKGRNQSSGAATSELK